MRAQGRTWQLARAGCVRILRHLHQPATPGASYRAGNEGAPCSRSQAQNTRTSGEGAGRAACNT